MTDARARQPQRLCGKPYILGRHAGDDEDDVVHCGLEPFGHKEPHVGMVWWFDSPDEADNGLILTPRREALLMQVAEMWRGDWTGHRFDGDDGHGWIDTALHGTDADLDALKDTLDRINEDR